jgi:hypothetical protein
MPLASALELLQTHAACAMAEALVPLLAVLAGFGGTWLQAAHPPANAHEHDPALVALLVV